LRQLQSGASAGCRSGPLRSHHTDPSAHADAEGKQVIVKPTDVSCISSQCAGMRPFKPRHRVVWRHDEHCGHLPLPGESVLGHIVWLPRAVARDFEAAGSQDFGPPDEDKGTLVVINLASCSIGGLESRRKGIGGAGPASCSTGPADADTLAVLAQAACLCWFECQYARDLPQVCRAIGTGKPTSSFSCLQIPSDRWTEINTYVVADQRWLDVDQPPPPGIDHAKMHTIVQWLGERSPAKDALAALFLCQLVDQLVLRASFSKLGQDPAPEGSEYVDFTPWYNRADGTQYATGSDYDGPRKRGPGGHFAEECKQSVRQEMSAAPCPAMDSRCARIAGWRVSPRP
jgi:hypothetical protein